MPKPENEDDWTQDIPWMRDMPPGMPTGPAVGNATEGEQSEEQPYEAIIVFVIQSGPVQA